MLLYCRYGKVVSYFHHDTSLAFGTPKTRPHTALGTAMMNFAGIDAMRRSIEDGATVSLSLAVQYAALQAIIASQEMLKSFSPRCARSLTA